MEKKIPRKNYIILGLIIFFTVIGAFYIRSWYITSKEYYAQNSVMKDVLREIKSEEIENYTLESQKFILYVSSGHNPLVKQFESYFKTVVKTVDDRDNILYLNIDEVNAEDFTTMLKDKFAKNEKIKNQITADSDATIYFFDNGKIISVYNNVNEYSNKRIELLINSWSKKNA